MAASFCTLFDSNYLFQGVALYHSLRRHSPGFTLYVLCMDQVAYDMIAKLGKRDLVPISVAELEDEAVREVRARTTHGQFCWVCQPLICRYLLDRFQPDMITYLEADSLFFSDPSVLFRELEGSDVSLVPHRYSKGQDNSAIAGRYCVQFNAFRNSPEALQVLDYWRECCFGYSKEKPHSYPGQTTLDLWPGRFPCVREIRHIGAGVAPWNVQQYRITAEGEQVLVDGVPVVFYHYHEFARYADKRFELGRYPLSETVVARLYRPYVRALNEAEAWVRSVDPGFSSRRQVRAPKGVISLLGDMIVTAKRKIRGTYNVFPADFFDE